MKEKKTESDWLVAERYGWLLEQKCSGSERGEGATRNHCGRVSFLEARTVWRLEKAFGKGYILFLSARGNLPPIFPFQIQGRVLIALLGWKLIVWCFVIDLLKELGCVIVIKNISFYKTWVHKNEPWTYLQIVITVIN